MSPNDQHGAQQPEPSGSIPQALPTLSSGETVVSPCNSDEPVCRLGHCAFLSP